MDKGRGGEGGKGGRGEELSSRGVRILHIASGITHAIFPAIILEAGDESAETLSGKMSVARRGEGEGYTYCARARARGGSVRPVQRQQRPPAPLHMCTWLLAARAVSGR